MSLFNVGFVIFPELTQLDFSGPPQVLARLPQSAMHIVAKSVAPGGCPLVAQSRHGLVHCTCPLSGGKADMTFCGANVCL